MALEQRAGRQYFYRKERHGNRVRSVYVGGGSLGRAAGYLHESEQERKLEERQREIEERERLDAMERRVIESERGVRELLSAVLTGAGYHRHHGTWRKRRGHA